MFPQPSSLLPIAPWISVSVPRGKVTQIFSYCTFFSLLPLAVLRPYYIIHGPDFYSEFFEAHKV
jgi:hypothetical protein